MGKIYKKKNIESLTDSKSILDVSEIFKDILKENYHISYRKKNSTLELE